MVAFSPRLLCLRTIGRLRGRRFDSANGPNKEEIMPETIFRVQDSDGRVLGSLDFRANGLKTGQTMTICLRGMSSLAE